MTHEDYRSDSDAVLLPWHELDALLDGEPVDRNALRTVLAAPDAREYLVEALLLRRLTQRMDPARVSVPDPPRRAVLQPRRWIAAAVVVVTSVAGGYLYGQRAEASPASIEVSVDTTAAPPPAPEPTRAIRFEPGVNWTTRTGGH
jgi:hypothetical protein